ncbi:MAG: threonine ammonia-lyase IlvA [Bacteroidales bacterium]|jgi:threonine dehydratase|nr:threonine ammonia-lyase IlvA [Bacteroidales bacterium]
MSLLSDFGLRVEEACQRLSAVILHTPLQLNRNLSALYEANIYLKREDLQEVRSYKLRGAYNMISQLQHGERQRGVVCASAGNHAQGFAYSCRRLGIRGVVFMPKVTPRQKIQQTRRFGEDHVIIRLTGDTFDDCAEAAKTYAADHRMTFIPPFDDPRIIEGQGTIGVELLEDLPVIDCIFIPIGGGGLCAGVGAYIRDHSPATSVIGVEPQGAQSMKAAFEAGHPVTLEHIERFVDGAAVKRAGDLTYRICRRVVDDICPVPEGRVCSTILKLYNEDAIVAEPAGALSIAALDDYAGAVKGKNVVCIVSGSNNDIDRMQEIRERSLQFERLKHYFLIRFAQRPGALKDFVNRVLGPNDDIVRFEYMKKTNKDDGPALVGIELNSAHDYDMLIRHLKEYQFDFTALAEDDSLFAYLV